MKILMATTVVLSLAVGAANVFIVAVAIISASEATVGYLATQQR